MIKFSAKLTGITLIPATIWKISIWKISIWKISVYGPYNATVEAAK